jgi:5'-deoxynucleotidase YfbR-like HD superfamily hydrolase
MNSTADVLQLSNEEILDIARQLRVGYEMKRVLRFATTRDPNVHTESDAEHVFGLLFLAQYFLPLEDPERRLDVAQVHKILLYHDFPEIKHGDISYHLKTLEHEERERAAARGVFDSLPASLREEAHEAWLDYEYKRTPEGMFVYALDKLEPLFELFDPVTERTMKTLNFSYSMHFQKKFDATANFPVMRRFVEVISQDMLKRGVFVD